MHCTLYVWTLISCLMYTMTEMCCMNVNRMDGQYLLLLITSILYIFLDWVQYLSAYEFCCIFSHLKHFQLHCYCCFQWSSIFLSLKIRRLLFLFLLSGESRTSWISGYKGDIRRGWRHWSSRRPWPLWPQRSPWPSRMQRFDSYTSYSEEMVSIQRWRFSTCHEKNSCQTVSLRSAWVSWWEGLWWSSR